jgi:hypothetical protein
MALNTVGTWSITASDGTIFGSQNNIVVDPVAGSATIQTCDITATAKSTFNPDDSIYIKGNGYSASKTYNLYVVLDQHWPVSMPSRIGGTVTSISNDSSGNINVNTRIWDKVAAGQYDIVVDINGNGQYDAGIDAICNNIVGIGNTAGFLVLPEYALGGLAALCACFIGFAVFKKCNNLARLR